MEKNTHCVVCNTKLSSTQRMYCSNKCKQAAKYQERKKTQAGLEEKVAFLERKVKRLERELRKARAAAA